MSKPLGTGMIKKLPMELTRFRGDLSEFTHKSMLDPVSSSFFTALGLSIFETLVRIKPKNFLTESAWKNVFEKLDSIEDLAKDMNMYAFYEDFKEFLRNLKRSDRLVSKKMLESSISGGNINFEAGFKLLFCSCSDQDCKSIMTNTVNPKIILNDIVKNLSIHIVHIENEEYIVYKNKNIAPLVFICSHKKHYGIPYHTSIKYLDEKTEPGNVDFRSFPFLYNPSKKFSLRTSYVKDNAVHQCIEIINILVQNIKPLDLAVKTKVRKHINALKTFAPEFEDRLEEIYGKTASLCDHTSKEYTPICLKSHCMACLIDAVLDSSSNTVLCPCGIPMDNTDIMFLSSNSPSKDTKLAYRKFSVSPRGKYNNKPFIRKNSSKRRQSLDDKLPAIAGKTACSMCRQHLTKDKYDGIRCLGHYLCLDCRATKVKNGIDNCPVCERPYSDDEITVLRMINNSIDLTSTLLKAGSFIDGL